MIDKVFILYSMLCGILDILVVQMLILFFKHSNIRKAFTTTDWVYFAMIHVTWIISALVKYEVI